MRSIIPEKYTWKESIKNKNGGVCVAIGKYLKGSRIDFNAENTFIVDVNDFSETIRIIALFTGQTKNLEELESYIIENTIIIGDFNASINEWSSASSDKRVRDLIEWVEKNNLC